MKYRNQSKAEAMRSHIEACAKSGLSVSDYCTQNGLVKSSYYYWYKRLTMENTPSGFIPISVNSKAAGSVEIIYPNAVQLSYSGNLDVALLKALVCCI